MWFCCITFLHSTVKWNKGLKILFKDFNLYDALHYQNNPPGSFTPKNTSKIINYHVNLKWSVPNQDFWEIGGHKHEISSTISYLQFLIRIGLNKTSTIKCCRIVLSAIHINTWVPLRTNGVSGTDTRGAIASSI